MSEKLILWSSDLQETPTDTTHTIEVVTADTIATQAKKYTKTDAMLLLMQDAKDNLKEVSDDTQESQLDRAFSYMKDLFGRGKKKTRLDTWAMTYEVDKSTGKVYAGAVANIDDSDTDFEWTSTLFDLTSLTLTEKNDFFQQTVKNMLTEAEVTTDETVIATSLEKIQLTDIEKDLAELKNAVIETQDIPTEPSIWDNLTNSAKGIWATIASIFPFNWVKEWDEVPVTDEDGKEIWGKRKLTFMDTVSENVALASEKLPAWSEGIGPKIDTFFSKWMWLRNGIVASFSSVTSTIWWIRANRWSMVADVEETQNKLKNKVLSVEETTKINDLDREESTTTV